MANTVAPEAPHPDITKEGCGSALHGWKCQDKDQWQGERGDGKNGKNIDNAVSAMGVGPAQYSGRARAIAEGPERGRFQRMGAGIVDAGHAKFHGSVF